ncbi:hypothetical protein JYK00_00600 [Thermosipho ferrireducens]|uniref:CBM20 domain-containing protein n=1 Tax=Thermosipho ferrireducens TaxID=2571116 RepID=A0ABX7S681_9BACT|nr:hypothetical protein [Thermosipho ferrireducens]QTA38083.1 hypothetical protein JYK00_00600 [Thermosipho ferrireducens]
MKKGLLITFALLALVFVLFGCFNVVPPVTPGIAFEVLLPDTTEATQIFVVGSMNGWNKANPWITLNVVEKDGKKYAVGEVPVGSDILPAASVTGGAEFEYKYLAGKDWAYVEKQADGSNDIANRFMYVDEFSKIFIKDAVLNWAGAAPTAPATSAITVKFVAYVPSTTPDGSIVQLAGSMNGWNGEDMTKEGDVWTITKQLEANTYYEFKLRLGSDWSYPEGNKDGGYRGNRGLILSNDATVTIKVLSWENM